MCPETKSLKCLVEGLSTLPRGTFGPRKGRAQLPIAAQCLAYSDVFSWLPSKEWTLKVALVLGFLPNPPIITSVGTLPV